MGGTGAIDIITYVMMVVFKAVTSTCMIVVIVVATLETATDGVGDYGNSINKQWWWWWWRSLALL